MLFIPTHQSDRKAEQRFVGSVWGGVAVACIAVAVAAPAAHGQAESISLTNSSYVRADSAASIAPPQFTLETWFRADGPGYGFANDGFGAALINKPGEGLVGESLTSWGLFWSSSTQRIFAHITHQLYTSGTYLQSNAVVPLGTLAHAAMTFDGTTLRLYINGQLDAQTATPTSAVYYSTTMPVLIGASNFGAGYTRRFQGLLDEVRIWDHALTGAEIGASFSCQPTGPQPGLLAAWNFDGSSLSDASGNGRDGTAPGGVTLSYAPQPAAIRQPPTVMTSPNDAAACGGGAATFVVTAGGGSATYHWQVQDAGAWVNLSDGSGVAIGPSYSGNAQGSATTQLTVSSMMHLRPHPNVVPFRCVVSNSCGSADSDAAMLTLNSADFNGDGDVGTDADIQAFFACLSGNCCPSCGSADFNGDRDVGTDADIESFFRVLGGGPC